MKIYRIGIALVICLVTLGCVKFADIKWESTPLAGKVLRTVARPSQSGLGRVDIAIKLEESGEVVLVRATNNMPLITRDKRVNIYQGITDSGRKFYSFNLPQSNPNQEP